MIEVVDSVVIERPIQEVWDFMADLDQAHVWGLWTEAVKTSDGPIAVGTTYRSSEAGLGLKITADLKILEWEPPTKMTFWSAIFPSRRFGPLKPATLSFALEPIDGTSTRVTRHAGGETHGTWRILDPVITAGIRREKEEATVKKLIESRPSS